LYVGMSDHATMVGLMSKDTSGFCS